MTTAPESSVQNSYSPPRDSTQPKSWFDSTMTTKSKPKSILFLTNSEIGQAQVHIAIAHEILCQSVLEVHFASFPDLNHRILRLQELHPSTPIRFHPITAPSMTEALNKKKVDFWQDLTHPPSVVHAVKVYKQLPGMKEAWEWDDYLMIYERCAQIVVKLEPAIVVVDWAFHPALDVCRNLKLSFVLTVPIDLIHLLSMLQPALRILWMYPAFCSGFPFPLPRHLVMANTYLLVRLIIVFLFSSRLRIMARSKKAAGLGGHLVMTPWRADEEYICPSLPELESPSMFVPGNVTPCGPIVVSVRPVGGSDPGLARWLQKQRTILVNLGSHVVLESSDALELAIAIKSVIDRHHNVQVLWKSNSAATGDVKALLRSDLGDIGRVRIESWLGPDPTSLMESGHVICSVHHGGANSFYEATGFGIPQIVLPIWCDTYDFANRVEYLGIGIWANKTVAPHVRADELRRAMTAVLEDGEKGERRRARARELGELCGKAGGRKKACAKILELIEREPIKT